MTEKIVNKFRELFQGEPALYTAPGRVNLIGEHTDYNLGFVLPGAIDKAIYIAIKPNGSDTVNLYSADYDASVSFKPDGEKPAQLWASFVYGVVKEMQKKGTVIGGFDAVFGGNVPLGAGLSSSAALESVFGTALNELFDGGFTKEQLAEIGQMTEHNYIGVKCGIMDQFASIFGEKGKVIKLDCRSLEYETIPFDPKGCHVVLIDSMVKHSLASSEYNVRRHQCEEGVKVVASHEEGIESLRDVTKEMLEKYRNEIDPVSYRRCWFILEENDRVIRSCEALKSGDLQEFGKLLYEGHKGLSEDYEVSCAELDYIISIAREHKGVVGARMMGGGFGGCVINIVEEDAVADYLADVQRRFKEKFGLEPRIIEVEICDGARRLA